MFPDIKFCSLLTESRAWISSLEVPDEGKAKLASTRGESMYGVHQAGRPDVPWQDDLGRS